MYTLNYLSRSVCATKAIGDRKYKITASAMQTPAKGNNFNVDMIRVEVYEPINEVETIIGTVTIAAGNQSTIGFNVPVELAKQTSILVDCDAIKTDVIAYLVEGIALPA